MKTLPYQWLLDNGWSIVSMNHCYVDNNERHLICTIVKNGTHTHITGEDASDLEVFRRLEKLAKKLND